MWKTRRFSTVLWKGRTLRGAPERFSPARPQFNHEPFHPFPTGRDEPMRGPLPHFHSPYYYYVFFIKDKKVE